MNAEKRQSVFSRLGPMPGEEEKPSQNCSKDGSDNLTSLLGLKSLDDEIAMRRQNSGQRKQPSKAKNDRKGQSTPRRPEQPAKMIQRTISEIQRSRTKTDDVARQQQTAPNPENTDAAALKEQLRQLEEERKAAQQLADTLMLQQQALLEEKQRVARENESLQTEKQHLLERLNYLEEYDECSDFSSPSYYGGAGMGFTPEPVEKMAPLDNVALDTPDTGGESGGSLESIDLERLQI